MTTISPFAAGSYVSNRNTSQLLTLKNQLNDLSNQLSSGKVSQTYGGLGTGRSTALAAQAGPRTVLLAHRASLAARYWDAGGRELLVSLQEAARRPGAMPHGLWLLVPMDDPKASPVLDGRPVDVVDRASEWEVLEGLFLRELHGLPVAS